MNSSLRGCLMLNIWILSGGCDVMGEDGGASINTAAGSDAVEERQEELTSGATQGDISVPLDSDPAARGIVTPAAAGPSNVRGAQHRNLRLPDGRINVDTIIGRLEAMHADTYMFPIEGQQDWDDLPEFAEAAQAAGINVWVYLWPPASCKDADCTNYPPYGKDYEGWATSIAQLSKRYPVVTAWVIDDFANSRDDLEKDLTPDYLRMVQAKSHAIQPTLEFYPVVYYHFLGDTFDVPTYAPVIDALILPYRDDPYHNTLFTGSLSDQLDVTRDLLSPYGRKVILMVYGLYLGRTQVSPDVDYVRRNMKRGLARGQTGDIAGVVLFSAPLDPNPSPGDNNENYSHGDGKGALVLNVQVEQKTSAGDLAGAGAVVSLDPGSTSCVMSFWHRDNRPADPSKVGYHFKQVTALRQVIWERDVMIDDSEWHQVQINVTPFMIDGSTSIDLLLREKQGVTNINVLAFFDDISLTGCSLLGGGHLSFETTGGWNVSRTGGPVLVGQHIYDPVYTESVFEMVAEMYAE